MIGSPRRFTPAQRFTPLQRLLHWLMALCILAMLFIGVGMVSTVAPKYLTLVSIHKSLGIAILILALICLAVRLGYGAPRLPTDLPEPMKLAAYLSHYALYIFMIGMPLLGWGMMSAEAYPIVLLGGIRLRFDLATWLNSLGVAQFASHHAGQVRGVPLETWVFHQDREAGMIAFEGPARKALEARELAVVLELRLSDLEFSRRQRYPDADFGGSFEADNRQTLESWLASRVQAMAGGLGVKAGIRNYMRVGNGNP